MPGVWVYAEVSPEGKVESGALENLTKAREVESVEDGELLCLTLVNPD